MSLQQEMDALVSEVSGALGAIIVDFEGEAVVTACGDLPAHDLKVIGAYGGIFLDQIKRITKELELGPASSYVIEAAQSRLLNRVLNDGYFIVLILERHANLPVARARLEHSHARLLHEF